MDPLIIGARRFEQDALTAIYDQYSSRLYRYAMRLMGDVYLAEECVAETFDRFLKALRSGGGPRDHLQAYLYRIAHNWITDQFRRQPPPPLNLDESRIADIYDHLSAVELQTEQERMRAALRYLTPDQRQVIVLKYLEGMDNENIAATLEKPVGAVKSLQHRALAALRKLLGPMEGDE
jgi:RNA polymerase sigma-70 factor (ECF subfamily)